MKATEKDTPGDDDRRFDLLVDGELSQREHRELLAGLDDEPSGWRCCALAFLEAQAWEQDFGPIVGFRKGTVPFLQRENRTRSSRLSRHTGMLLAMAASFLVALYLGLLLRGVQGPGNPPARPPIDAIAGMGAVAKPAQESLQPESVQPDVLLQGETPESPWRMVTLATTEGPHGKSESIRLPAVERDSIDEDWLAGVPAAMPADVLRALERTGHKVHQRRELLPLRMKDGRRLVVPVDQVDVHYVGGPAL